jgi:DNA polymerase
MTADGVATFVPHTAQSLLCSAFRLTARRGEELRLPAEALAGLGVDPGVVVTAHPSSVLRGPAEEREKNFDVLVADLRFATGLRFS